MSHDPKCSGCPTCDPAMAAVLGMNHAAAAAFNAARTATFRSAVSGKPCGCATKAAASEAEQQQALAVAHAELAKVRAQRAASVSKSPNVYGLPEPPPISRTGYPQAPEPYNVPADKAATATATATTAAAVKVVKPASTPASEYPKAPSIYG